MSVERSVRTDVVGGALSPRGPEIPWGNDGTTVAVSATPELRPRSNVTAVGMSATLTTAGSSTTTVQLFKNGTMVRTMDIPAGETYVFMDFALPVRYRSRTDRYQIVIPVVGSGAVGIAGALELAG